jgi:hypothetical protein
VLGADQWRAAGGVAHGHGERGEHAGDGGVYARQQHEAPKHEAKQPIPKRFGDAAPVHHQHGDERDRRAAERPADEVRRVEERDHDDSAEIVDDGEREQEEAQAPRHARTEQRHDADRESDVGGGGDRPAAQEGGLVRVERDIDQRGCGHAAQRAGHGQGGFARVLERAFDGLALQLEADIQKEDHHQPVIDDEVQVERVRAFSDSDRAKGVFEYLMQAVAERRIQQQERSDRRREQNITGCGVSVPPGGNSAF